MAYEEPPKEYKNAKDRRGPSKARPIGDPGPRNRPDDSAFYAFLIFLFFSSVLFFL